MQVVIRRTLVKNSAVELSRHHEPQNLSDRFALGCVKLLRFVADTFFAKRYG
ncbi:MAG: oxidase, partial [Proteobacteria bacterium]|nr:oxidase [Pseudomonadota bacterium]